MEATLAGWTTIKDPRFPQSQVRYLASDAEIVVAYEGEMVKGVAVLSRRAGESFTTPRARDLRFLTEFGARPRGTPEQERWRNLPASLNDRGSIGWSGGPVKVEFGQGGLRPLRFDEPPTPQQQADFAGMWVVTYSDAVTGRRDLKPDGTFTASDGWRQFMNGQWVFRPEKRSGRWRVSETRFELRYRGGGFESFALPSGSEPLTGTRGDWEVLTATREKAAQP